MQSLHWFLDPIKNHYADFDGRVGRQEFWMFILFSCGLSLILEIVGIDVISIVVSLLLFLPSFALGARRLHDTGRSGWWQLLWLIPIIGWIIIIILCAIKGDASVNRFGPVPPAKNTSGPETPVAPVAPDSPAVRDADVVTATPAASDEKIK